MELHVAIFGKMAALRRNNHKRSLTDNYRGKGEGKGALSYFDIVHVNPAIMVSADNRGNRMGRAVCHNDTAATTKLEGRGGGVLS